jgi:glycosyltransferase involved in cell wall biosynthesis
MLNDQRIAVIVPAYCEERLILSTLRSIPGWVDLIVVVDDASLDRTIERIGEFDDPRLQCLTHSTNRGVGAAIVTGYRRALSLGAQVMAVMAGDRQMDPHDLGNVVNPVVEGRADYVKGNRFAHPKRLDMPTGRRWAGRGLAAATRLATGLHVTDTQCGYTALSADTARRLPLEDLWPRFGYPNDLLGMLAAHGARVTQVPVCPVYASEKSGVRPWHALIVLGVIGRRWYRERAQAGVTATLSASQK